ncbi:MAG: DUF6220 domain-containing protein [Gaiellaceae bacterium]
MSQARVIYFGLVALYLAGAVVQFFLAGLAVFGDTSFDLHSVLGFILGIASIVLLVVALVGRLPRTLLLLTVLLVGLNVLQLVLANVDLSEVAALHPVNGVAIVFLAYELTQRSRRYVVSKMAA